MRPSRCVDIPADSGRAFGRSCAQTIAVENNATMKTAMPAYLFILMMASPFRANKWYQAVQDHPSTGWQFLTLADRPKFCRSLAIFGVVGPLTPHRIGPQSPMTARLSPVLDWNYASVLLFRGAFGPVPGRGLVPRTPRRLPHVSHMR